MSSMDDQEPPVHHLHSHWHGSVKSVLPIVVVTSAAFCLGYDAGMMSGAILPIKLEYHLSSVEEGMVVGACNLFAGLGAITGSLVADRLGRVNGFAATAAVLFVGPLLLVASQGYWGLVLSRSLIGIGIGWSFIVAPLYAAEMSPPAVRGSIVSLVEIVISCGVLLGLSSALLLQIPHSDPNVMWRVTCGLAALPALVGLFFWPCLPESPRWLVQVGRRKEAESVLLQMGAVLNAEELEEELADIDASIEAEGGSWGDIICPSTVTRRMLVAGAGAPFYSQACGSEALIYYSPLILRHMGMASEAMANEATVAVGLTKLGATLVAASMMDIFGRRPAMLISTTGLFLALVALASALNMRNPFIGLLLLCCFQFSMNVGVGPGGFVLGSECFPTSIRAKGLAVGMTIGRVVSGTVAVAFPAMVDAMTMRGALLFFSSLSFTGIFWAWCCVPETKGLTLEEAPELFSEQPLCRPPMKRQPSPDELRPGE